MANDYLDAFFEHFKYTGLTYDDVSMVTQYADFLPHESDLRTRLTRNITMNIPYVSAAMDTVTESKMAIAMALNGGIGIIHKNLEATEQRTNVKQVKYYLNGFLTKARTVSPDQTVEELNRLKDEKGWSFNTFPVLDNDKKLIGMVTRREFKYCSDPSIKLGDIMIRDVKTGPINTTIDEARDIMHREKINVLPIIDDSGVFEGMYCYKDVEDILKGNHPFYNRDEDHRLRCGAAVGPNTFERVECLMETDVDVLVVDTAHGHSKGVIDMVKWIKQHYPQVDVIAGNVAAPEGARALADAGADGVKVGVGPGSICTTRVVAGVGVPQLSAVYECAKELRGTGVGLIADGGIRYSGDVPKALAAGADCVMMGGVLAGTDESPGERVLYHGRQYVIYRGMGSMEAMTQRFGSADRYGQSGVEVQKMVPEGIEGMLPYAGPVDLVMSQFIGGLRQSMGYNGCRTISELKDRARFKQITGAGVRESHPHDITMTKDAPNYKANER
ncbi:MAG: IMP dehydrogenase, partial [Candidatus Sumerlaeia bacterium]